MMQDLKKWTEDKYVTLYKKYFNSRTWFIVLNVLSFVLVASMVILNIYAIKKNPYPDTIKFYVSIAILTGFMGLITSIVSFFTLNKNTNKFKKQYQDVREQYNQYKKKDGQYSNAKTRDEILVDEVLKIIHEE